MKTKKNLSQQLVYRQDLGLEPAEYKAGALLTLFATYNGFQKCAEQLHNLHSGHPVVYYNM
jgi:hypothetical protein